MYGPLAQIWPLTPRRWYVSQVKWLKWVTARFNRLQSKTFETTACRHSENITHLFYHIINQPVNAYKEYKSKLFNYREPVAHRSAFWYVPNHIALCCSCWESVFLSVSSWQRQRSCFFWQKKIKKPYPTTFHLPLSNHSNYLQNCNQKVIRSVDHYATKCDPLSRVWIENDAI